MLGKEVSSASIGGVPYREGIFNTWNDPAKFGLFYHCSLITRRADVRESEALTRILLENPAARPDEIEALKISTEAGKTGVLFNKQPEAIPANKVLVKTESGEVRSDTGEMYRSWKKNFGIIDSERTKCVYGFLSKQGEIKINGLKLKVLNDFAIIALSSLTEKSLSRTDNILLTAVGKSENKGMKFDDSHTEMLDYGGPPILIEKIEAEIELENQCDSMKVWAVNAEGFYTGCVPSVFKEGKLIFKIGDVFPSMYYLIRSE